MPRRYYANGAPLLTLSSAVNTTATTLTVSSTSGYPGTTPYTICLERGTVNEEVCLVTGATGTTFTVTRGWDGTTAKSHASATSVEHTTSAIDYTEANIHVNDTTTDVHSQYMLKSLLSAKGSLVSASAAATPSVISVGSNNLALLADSAQAGGIKWGQVVNASIADGAVTFAKLDTALQYITVRSVANYTSAAADNGSIVYSQADLQHVAYLNNTWQWVPYGVRRISYGTAAPSGGNDGDVYLKYV